MNHEMEATSVGRASSSNSRIARAASGVEAYQGVLIFTGVLILIAYGGALGYQFVYDDRPQIVANTFVHSWRFASRYFIADVWGSIVPGVLSNYYRPMFLFWLRLNHMLFGLAPWGWHLTSILAHLGVTLSVYTLAARLTRDRLTAALAAMIFGVHPVHVEGVVWVSGVTEPMLALFFITSFLAYLRAREGGERARGWRALSAILFLLALFSKETAVMLPAFILIYEGLLGWGPASGHPSLASGPWGTRARNALKWLMPYVAVTPVYLIPRGIALKGLSHVLTPMPFATLVFTAPSVLWFYLKRLVWPVHMALMYNTPYVRSPHWVDFGLPLAGIGAVIFLLWAWGRRAEPQEGNSRARVVAFASLWIFLPLVPPLNITALPLDDFVHDRYTYLPSVGFAILLAMALRSIDMGGWRIGTQPAVQWVLVAALAAAGVSGTLAEGLFWSNGLLLYHRALSVSPNDRTKINLANALAEGGYQNEAIVFYKEVLAHRPKMWEANYNLGLSCYELHRFEEAERYFRQAVKSDSTKAGSYLYLGLAELKLGHTEAAAGDIHQSMRINPNVYGVHFARGIVLKLQGDFPEAIEEFKKELALNPSQSLAREQIAEIERGQPNFQGRSSSVAEGGP